MNGARKGLPDAVFMKKVPGCAWQLCEELPLLKLLQADCALGVALVGLLKDYGWDLLDLLRRAPFHGDGSPVVWFLLLISLVEPLEIVGEV